MTGIGPVAVRCPRVRDRTADGGERIRFSSAICRPTRADRRPRSADSDPLLERHLHRRLRGGVGCLARQGRWRVVSLDHRAPEGGMGRRTRPLARSRPVRQAVFYFWVDGIYVQARLEDDAQCLLVIIGATTEGKKELVGLADGIRESAQSWKGLLLDLKRRGLTMAPQLAVADGALGFWKAIDEVWPKMRAQRCWVHKTANVLNKLPKSLQAKAKRALQDIWMAETRKDAEVAFDGFIESYGVKYEKAVECLSKDREPLLAFYDIPAEHWKHLRTTNPIESTFATVRHRRVRSRGCLSNKTALAMIYKLAQAAEKSWHRLRGYNQLPKVIIGVKFNDEIEVVQSKAAEPVEPRHQRGVQARWDRQGGDGTAAAVRRASPSPSASSTAFVISSTNSGMPSVRSTIRHHARRK